MGCVQSKREDINDRHRNIFAVKLLNNNSSIVLNNNGNNANLLNSLADENVWLSGHLELRLESVIFQARNESPKIWEWKHIRRYGQDGPLFMFETGRRAGQTFYKFHCKTPEKASALLEQAKQCARNPALSTSSTMRTMDAVNPVVDNNITSTANNLDESRLTNLTGGNAGGAAGVPLQNGEIDHNSEAVLNNLRQAAQLDNANLRTTPAVSPGHQAQPNQLTTAQEYANILPANSSSSNANASSSRLTFSTAQQHPPSPQQPQAGSDGYLIPSNHQPILTTSENVYQNVEPVLSSKKGKPGELILSKTTEPSGSSSKRAVGELILTKTETAAASTSATSPALLSYAIPVGDTNTAIMDTQSTHDDVFVEVFPSSNNHVSNTNVTSSSLAAGTLQNNLNNNNGDSVDYVALDLQNNESDNNDEGTVTPVRNTSSVSSATTALNDQSSAQVPTTSAATSNGLGGQYVMIDVQKTKALNNTARQRLDSIEGGNSGMDGPTSPTSSVAPQLIDSNSTQNSAANVGFEQAPQSRRSRLNSSIVDNMASVFKTTALSAKRNSINTNAGTAATTANNNDH